jgi:ribosomal protein S12 methylthiotransferase
VGQFVDVEITDADEHDLFGDAVGVAPVVAERRPIDLTVL